MTKTEIKIFYVSITKTNKPDKFFGCREGESFWLNNFFDVNTETSEDLEILCMLKQIIIKPEKYQDQD